MLEKAPYTEYSMALTRIYNQCLDCNSGETSGSIDFSKSYRVLFRKHSPISSDAQSAPRDRKKEYIVIVSMKIKSRLMKNCDGVRARFAML
jgi:hypothetical protein